MFFWMCGLPFEWCQSTRSHTINRTQQPLSQELQSQITPEWGWDFVVISRSMLVWLVLAQVLCILSQILRIPACRRDMIRREDKWPSQSLIYRRPSSFQLSVTVSPNMTPKHEVKTEVCLCEGVILPIFIQKWHSSHRVCQHHYKNQENTEKKQSK